MSQTATEPRESPKPHRFTREEYYRMGEQGMFVGRRVELIDGEIVDRAPQTNRHFLALSCTGGALATAFGPGYWIRHQGPLHPAGESAPEPDVVVVPGPMESYKEHPAEAMLVVEVSDATLRFDRGKKASLYARADIQDYWIVNLVNNTLEIHREPIRDGEAPLGWRFKTKRVLTSSESVSPLAKPEAQIQVADLLP